MPVQTETDQQGKTGTILNIRQKIKSGLEQTVVRALLFIILITVIAAVVVSYSEAQQQTGFNTFWDSVWWVIVTISTVGYGDKVPITPLGRITAVTIMLFGIALLSVITATISSIFVTRKIREEKGLQEIKFKGHLLLCGWSDQAAEILNHLESGISDQKQLVLINQLPEEEVADVLSRYESLSLKFVRGDFTRENILNRANAKHASSAILLPDSSPVTGKSGDERTLLATLSLKTLNPKIKVYAHLLDKENLTHLRKAHADEVIVSDANTGYMLAGHVLSPGIPQFFDQLFKQESTHQLKRELIPREFYGQSYEDFAAYYRQNHTGILLGVGKITEPFQLADLMSDDSSYLDEFIMRKFQEAGRSREDEERVKVLINPPPQTLLNKNDFYLSIESKRDE